MLIRGIVVSEMPLFAVIALKNSASAIDEAMRTLVPGEGSYQIEPGKWVVNEDVSTAKELAVKLGIRERESHLILPIRGYTGRAQPDLWEWLSAQSGKTNG